MQIPVLLAQAPANLPPEAVTPNLPTNTNVIEPMVDKDTAPKLRACKQPARQVAMVDALAPAPKTRKATRSKAMKSKAT